MAVIYNAGSLGQGHKVMVEKPDPTIKCTKCEHWALYRSQVIDKVKVCRQTDQHTDRQPDV